MSDEIVERSADEIAQRVRDGRTSALEVAQAHLTRIDLLDSALQAFQHVRREEALREAAAFDASTSRHSAPLAGVPIVLNDDIGIAGVPMRRGSAATPSTPTTFDDELVVRLRRAGCTILGSTRMAEFGIWPFTEPAAYPAPGNPWRPTHSPGGAAGGAAAAVAAGMAALGVATDGSGAARVTASCCGLVGMKVTPNMISLPDGSLSGWYGLKALGTLSRSVADTALLLDALAGSPHWQQAPAPVQPMRIAYAPGHYSAAARVDPLVREATRLAANALQEAGHTVIAARPPYATDMDFKFTRRWLSGIAEDSAPFDAHAVERRTKKMASKGRGYAKKVQRAADDTFAAEMKEWFADYDLLLTPTLTQGAQELGKWSMGWLRSMMVSASWTYTTPWNVAGLPAMSIPSGTNEDGMPIGVQLVSGPGREATILAAATLLEQQIPWPQVAPV